VKLEFVVIAKHYKESELHWMTVIAKHYKESELHWMTVIASCSFFSSVDFGVILSFHLKYILSTNHNLGVKP
jgi:hypothetical protein